MECVWLKKSKNSISTDIIPQQSAYTRAHDRPFSLSLSIVMWRHFNVYTSFVLFYVHHSLLQIFSFFFKYPRYRADYNIGKLHSLSICNSHHVWRIYFLRLQIHTSLKKKKNSISFSFVMWPQATIFFCVFHGHRHSE